MTGLDPELWSVLGLSLRVSGLVLIGYAGLLVLTWWIFTTTPTGFIPAQDKGFVLVNVELPDASSLARTRQVMDQIEVIAKDTPGVSHTLSVAGQSFTLGANGSNFGNLFVTLDEFDKRRDPKLYSDKLARALQQRIVLQVDLAYGKIICGSPVGVHLCN